MKDVTPCIIVDNQKLSPVKWSPRSAAATAGPKERESRPFGIIDRVTISKKAREQFKQLETQVENDLPIPDDPSNKAPAAILPRLAYSPEKSG